MNRSLWIGVAMGAMVFAGCKPKAGASCKGEAKEVCVDEKQALACQHGTWQEMLCRGPRGCAVDGAGRVCDQSAAENNDVCNLERDVACSADKKRMLRCKQGHWRTAQNCLGDRACTLDDKNVTCDNSVAHLGDACEEENDHACSADKSSALVCHGGAFVLASPCKGRGGCRVTGGKGSSAQVDCDDSIATAGDPCDKDGNYACAADQTTILKCVDKRFIADDTCKAKQRCDVRGDSVGCY